MGKKSYFNKDIRLVEGSTLRVLSVGKKETMLTTEGIFKGYSGVGSDEGFCMEIKEAKKKIIRIIPNHMILAVDILKAAEPEEDEEAHDEPANYYG